MDADQVWGMLVFTALVSAAVGAAAHKWLFARAQEVKAKVSDITHDAADKIDDFRKNGL